MNDSRFPKLTDAQLQFILPFGRIVNYEKDGILFNVGDRAFDMNIVIEGSSVIQDPNNDFVVVVHDSNQFTGDSGMLFGRAAHLIAFAKANSKILHITKEAFKDNNE